VSATTAGSARRLGRVPAPALAGLAYLVLALAFWGPWVLDSPRSKILGANDVDPSAYLWFFSWWPHALGNGLNPFFTEVIFAPDGYNLTWVTSMPGPSLVLAPITETLGAVATWNLLMFAAPVLSAWTAYLLCRHLTAAELPSFVGGFLFGFSPYMLNQLRGAPQLALVALAPLIVLLVLRRLDGSLSERRFAIAVTAAFTAQILISTEVLATAVTFGALMLAGAYLLARERRAELRRLALVLGASLVATAVLVSPLLGYVLFGERTLPEQALQQYPADLLSFVVPGELIALSPERWGGTVPSWATGAAYFGVPLLVLIGAFAWTYRRDRTAQLVTLGFAITAICALGTALHAGGDDTGLPLPWWPFAELPLLRYAIPLRFPAYAFLAAALVVALWLARRPSPARWALTALAVALLLPAVGNRDWHTTLQQLPFFEDGTYADHLREGDRVLTLPAASRNMYWQVQADFSFDMAAGYVGATPESYTRYAAWRVLSAAPFASPGSVSPAQLRAFVDDKGVTAIVMDPRVGPQWAGLIDSLGARPQEVAGALLYRLRAPPAD
jgi:hypothetical protein